MLTRMSETKVFKRFLDVIAGFLIPRVLTVTRETVRIDYLRSSWS